jgi:hypothetical protein
MDQNERQIIDDLFAKLRRVEGQSGPRDAEVESHIREHVARLPAAPYLMAQAIVIQEQALATSQARIEELERQLHEQQRPAGGGFLGGLFGGARSPVPVGRSPWGPRTPAVPGDPRVAPYADPNQQRPGGGFLAGAMQTAMGVAGGMLIGNAVSSLFSSGEAHANEGAQPTHAAEEAPADDGGFFGGDEEL